MAMHIIRFIPFSIPFRFTFRVLVTPYIQSCMFYLAKFGYNLLHTFDQWLKSVNKKDRLDFELEIM